MKSIYLAGGCFWGTEKYLSLIPGVLETTVGYANGHTQNPTYHQVCHNHTGHAETVKVVYDEQKLLLSKLLALFFEVIDPTTLNKQGPDIGAQYRTGIYYTDKSDEPVIRAALDKLQQSIDAKVVVEALPLDNFYEAETYHQKYLDKNPGGYCHIGQKHFSRALGISPDELL